MSSPSTSKAWKVMEDPGLSELTAPMLLLYGKYAVVVLNADGFVKVIIGAPSPGLT